MKHILLLLIRAYQLVLSPILGNNCRFYPSCSHYSHDAIKHHGAIKGLFLSIWRVLRCNPWNKGGYDPVSGIPSAKANSVDDTKGDKHSK